MEHVPREIAKYIATFLDLSSLGNLSQANKYWSALLLSDEIWKQLCFNWNKRVGMFKDIASHDHSTWREYFKTLRFVRWEIDSAYSNSLIYPPKLQFYDNDRAVRVVHSIGENFVIRSNIALQLNKRYFWEVEYTWDEYTDNYDRLAGISSTNFSRTCYLGGDPCGYGYYSNTEPGRILHNNKFLSSINLTKGFQAGDKVGFEYCNGIMKIFLKGEPIGEVECDTQSWDAVHAAVYLFCPNDHVKLLFFAAVDAAPNNKRHHSQEGQHSYVFI